MGTIILIKILLTKREVSTDYAAPSGSLAEGVLYKIWIF